MKSLISIYLSAIAVLLSACGSEPPVESKSSAAMTSQGVRGSYLCGDTWWHVEQSFAIGHTSISGQAVTTISIPDLIGPGDDRTANAVAITCPGTAQSFVWGGYSYYNSQAFAGCSMWSHRANHGWSFAAYVTILSGGVQLYPGSPQVWEFDVWDASSNGTQDGIGPGCGGHFLLFLQ